MKVDQNSPQSGKDGTGRKQKKVQIKLKNYTFGKKIK